VSSSRTLPTISVRDEAIYGNSPVIAEQRKSAAKLLTVHAGFDGPPSAPVIPMALAFGTRFVVPEGNLGEIRQLALE